MEMIVMKYINREGHTLLAMLNDTQDRLTILNQDTMKMQSINELWINDYLLEDIDEFGDVMMKKCFFENMMNYMKENEDEYKEYIKSFDKITIID